MPTPHQPSPGVYPPPHQATVQLSYPLNPGFAGQMNTPGMPQYPSYPTSNTPPYPQTNTSNMPLYPPTNTSNTPLYPPTSTPNTHSYYPTNTPNTHSFPPTNTPSYPPSNNAPYSGYPPTSQPQYSNPLYPSFGQSSVPYPNSGPNPTSEFGFGATAPTSFAPPPLAPQPRPHSPVAPAYVSSVGAGPPSMNMGGRSLHSTHCNVTYTGDSTQTKVRRMN
jgi:hypothetical protein